jgi:hypothetical protein
MNMDFNKVFGSGITRRTHIVITGDREYVQDWKQHVPLDINRVGKSRRTDRIWMKPMKRHTGTGLILPAIKHTRTCWQVEDLDGAKVGTYHWDPLMDTRGV